MEKNLIIEGDTLTGPDGFKDSLLVVPDGVKHIGERALFHHGYFCTLVLPDGLETIEKEAFAGNAELVKVFIPKSVRSIARDAFADCYKMEVYCEGTVGSGWCNEHVKETVVEEVVTPEDDAFNFHRSGGGFTSHIWEHEVERHISWNPGMRPVHENVSREEFEKLI